ncbi:hypothetical protein ACWEQ4_00755 [Rhodococcus sp. NPDC003994]
MAQITVNTDGIEPTNGDSGDVDYAYTENDRGDALHLYRKPGATTLRVLIDQKMEEAAIFDLTIDQALHMAKALLVFVDDEKRRVAAL